MTKFNEIKLEFLRPGPSHNQLLSPLTPYMALCGKGAPITFHIDLEHYRLLNSLERLRYQTKDGRKDVAVADPMREAAVAEVGEDVAKILNKIPTLLGDEWRALGETSGSESNLIHMRIVLSGSELSLIPFELAFAPQSFPGEGLEWTLQYHLPIVPTREIRCTRPAPIAYDSYENLKILIVAADPGNLKVPLALHVHALRSALEPWIDWWKGKSKREELSQEQSKEESKREDYLRERSKLVKNYLRVLPRASIEEIYEACSREKFSFVHILAHGATIEVGGLRKFGLALCKDNNRNQAEVVTGKRLAKALLCESEDGSIRSQPLMVTLATCDSGNQGTVLVPGGSIAYDLHTAGIPWVFASQFPLTKKGSVRWADFFYPKILRGDDPRSVLYEARRQLYMLSKRDHDWASLVAYSTITKEFDEQVLNFFEKQTIHAINVSLKRADLLIEVKDSDTTRQVEASLEECKEKLHVWENRLPLGENLEERARRAHCYGIHGSTLKRIGLLWCKNGDEGKSQKNLKKALAYYRKAKEEGVSDECTNLWVSTQVLSLKAVLGHPRDPENYLIARRQAEKNIERTQELTRAWAFADMAELEILANYHFPERFSEDAEQRVKQWCQNILKLLDEDNFAIESTKRQFKRYIEYWGDKVDKWKAIAEVAVNALSPGKD
jgi:hypothetical protein